MKLGKLFVLFIVLGLLSACNIHHGNFSKQKFLDLKNLKDKEVVETNNLEEIYFEDLNNNSNFEDNGKSAESVTKIESEGIQSLDTDISSVEIEKVNFKQNPKTEESKNSIHLQKIVETPNLSDVTKKDKPKKTADQLFKLAALIFLLGLLLILVAIVGLFKSKMSEAAGFVYFMLGLISLILSAIYAIVGTNNNNSDKPRQRNIKRRDTVLFFGIFFVTLAMLFISGKV